MAPIAAEGARFATCSAVLGLLTADVGSAGVARINAHIRAWPRTVWRAAAVHLAPPAAIHWPPAARAGEGNVVEPKVDADTRVRRCWREFELEAEPFLGIERHLRAP